MIKENGFLLENLVLCKLISKIAKALAEKTAKIKLKGDAYSKRWPAAEGNLQSACNLLMRFAMAAMYTCLLPLVTKGDIKWQEKYT